MLNFGFAPPKRTDKRFVVSQNKLAAFLHVYSSNSKCVFLSAFTCLASLGDTTPHCESLDHKLSSLAFKFNQNSDNRLANVETRGQWSGAPRGRG